MTNTLPTTKPRVHLNGTSGEVLYKQQLDAIRAVVKALEALALAAPHGRDYYVVDDGAFARAQAEHQRRVRALEEVKAELWGIAHDVQDQLDARKR